MSRLSLVVSCLFAAGCGAVADPVDQPGELGPDAGAIEIDAPTTPPPDDIPLAPFDNDSAQAPAVDQFLSPTGERALVYGDQISAPDGDLADFMAFRLPSGSNSQQRVTVTLTCTILGELAVIPRAEVFAGGVQNPRTIACNEGPVFVTIDTTKSQLVRVDVASETPVHLDYELRVDAF